MIFLFPDLETFRLALSSAMVPPVVSQEAAEVAFDAEGRPSVKSHSIPPKTMQNALKRLGVKTGKAHYAEPVTVASWPEILPVVKVVGVLEFSTTAPVLFELPVDQLASFATEMLRLGNDRQSFRYLSGSNDPNQRVLLRVIGPPYYTLLRAVDHLTPDVVAYVEAAPRVWIEIGCTHPLAANLKVPEGRLLLLRLPRHWTTIEDAPYHDIYDILDFQLPKAAVDYAGGKLPGKLIVPLRIVAGNAADVPEMWVLKENAVDVFDAFVRDADERLMSRLIFAVAEKAILDGTAVHPLTPALSPEAGGREKEVSLSTASGKGDAPSYPPPASGGEQGGGKSESPIIVLRTRPSKLASPALELSGAVGYTSYRKLSNLFIPAGSRLQPTLRRDAVRKMLAEDADSIIWLAPLGDGRFAPESLPDDAFRPLQDWVDYVIDHERQVLLNWVEATSFDFDSFICKSDLPDDRPPPSKAKVRKPGERTKNQADTEENEVAEPTKGKRKSSAKGEEEAFAAPTVPVPPSELKIEREKLEKEFLANEGALESPERLALWPRLARINGALGENADAAICWLNALWQCDDLPADWLWAWRQGEDGSARREAIAADLDRALKNQTPTQSDMRQLAAMLLFTCTRTPIPISFKDRLPDIRHYLEKHDVHLGIRAVWLVWFQLSKISTDVLALARVRDRLIDRLFKNGLKPQYDVANFIRFSGQRDSNRLRSVQEQLLRFRGEVHGWLDSQNKTKDLLHKSLASTGWYADLLFAYGLAKLGEERHRADLMTAALGKLRSTKSASSNQDRIPLFLASAFEHRIQQAIRGEPAIGPLPADVLRTLDGMDLSLIYGVNKLREQLHILEPHEKSDPYLEWKKRQENLLPRDLAALQPISDPKRLTSEIRRILHNGGKALTLEDRLTALRETIPLATRVGRDFAQELLSHVLPALQPRAIGKSAAINYSEVELQAKLVNAAVPVAANYELVELLEQILTRFVGNLNLLDENAIIDSIRIALGQWLRSLRKCGLQAQLELLLKDLTALLLKGRTLDELRAEYTTTTKRGLWIDMLISLARLAECWISFGWHAQAMPFIDEVRLFLFAGKDQTLKDRPIVKYTTLVGCYIKAVGQLGEIDEVADRLSELLKNMNVIPNAQTTSHLYSGMHLGIVESLVLALVSDDFILGETARRWLDDDEYLVRRRIHSDMRKLLGQSGL